MQAELEKSFWQVWPLFLQTALPPLLHSSPVQWREDELLCGQLEQSLHMCWSTPFTGGSAVPFEQNHSLVSALKS
jgi:hypothetical protein